MWTQDKSVVGGVFFFYQIVLLFVHKVHNIVNEDTVVLIVVGVALPQFFVDKMFLQVLLILVPRCEDRSIFMLIISYLR